MATDPNLPKVFVSYRRSDSAAYAGRLADALTARLGKDNVFHDVGAITPGADFAEAIGSALATCDTSLVLIGPAWLGAAYPGGNRRLDDPEDFVRCEVAASLDTDVRVIPLLIGGASLPTQEELPEALASLPMRQAFELRDSAWHSDVAHLLDHIAPRPAAPVERSRRVVGGAALAAALTVSIVVAGLVWNRGRDGGGDDSGQIPPCSSVDESWTPLDVNPENAVVVEDDSELLRLEVYEGHFRESDGGPASITFLVGMENLLETGSPDNNPWFDAHSFSDLFVDGFAQGEATCFSLVLGGQDLGPGRQAEGLLGFAGVESPRDVALILETQGPAIQITSAP